jgi:signal transduction histidine kinase
MLHLSSLRFYAVAVASSGLALLLTLLIDDPLTEPNTLLVFLGAVMCSSWYGGFGPGVFATILTAVAFFYFYLPPPFSFEMNNPAVIVRMVEFVAVCLLISLLNELRRRYHRRAEMARAEAEAANRIKDAFLATVSHELRTPLAAIIGWTQVLRTRGMDGEASAQALETIERNVKAESRLVEDLLDVSRISAGQLRLNVCRTDVAEAIQTALDTMQPAIDAKHVQLCTAIRRGVGFVSGDAHRLQQVFWNLLSNAVKFTRERGRIEVGLEITDSHVYVVVRDTGRGIEPDLLPYVFERFRQGSDANAKRHGGLGLGLSIARQLVELHGGTIHAQSDGLGRGATFTVELPLIADKPGVVGAQMIPAVSVGSRGGRSPAQSRMPSRAKAARA